MANQYRQKFLSLRYLAATGLSPRPFAKQPIRQSLPSFHGINQDIKPAFNIFAQSNISRSTFSCHFMESILKLSCMNRTFELSRTTVVFLYLFSPNYPFYTLLVENAALRFLVNFKFNLMAKYGKNRLSHHYNIIEIVFDTIAKKYIK